MENFFYDDKFYSDLGDLIDDMFDGEEEQVRELEEGYSLECRESILEPVVTLSSQWVCEHIQEERMPEDDHGDRISDQLTKALKEIDFEKINSLMPKLYYPTRVKFTITKQDLIEYIS